MYSGEALKHWPEALCMWGGFFGWPHGMLWLLSFAAVDIWELKLLCYGGFLSIVGRLDISLTSIY